MDWDSDPPGRGGRVAGPSGVRREGSGCDRADRTPPSPLGHGEACRGQGKRGRPRGLPPSGLRRRTPRKIPDEGGPAKRGPEPRPGPDKPRSGHFGQFRAFRAFRALFWYFALCSSLSRLLPRLARVAFRASRAFVWARASRARARLRPRSATNLGHPRGPPGETPRRERPRRKRLGRARPQRVRHGPPIPKSARPPKVYFLVYLQCHQSSSYRSSRQVALNSSSGKLFAASSPVACRRLSWSAVVLCSLAK